MRNKYLPFLGIAFTTLPFPGDFSTLPVGYCALHAPIDLFHGEPWHLLFLLPYIPTVFLFFARTNRQKKIWEAFAISAYLYGTGFVFLFYLMAMFLGMPGDHKYFAIWAFPNLLAVAIFAYLAFKSMLKIDESPG